MFCSRLFSVLSWVVFPGVGIDCFLRIRIYSQGLTSKILLRRNRTPSPVTSSLLLMVIWSSVVAQIWRETELEQSEFQATESSPNETVNKSGSSLIEWGMWRSSLLPLPSWSSLSSPQTLAVPGVLMGFLAQSTVPNLAFLQGPGFTQRVRNSRCRSQFCSFLALGSLLPWSNLIHLA